jgi:hypothetical protein
MKRLRFTLTVVLVALAGVRCAPDAEPPREPDSGTARGRDSAVTQRPARDRERWAVKTGADADAASVAIDRPRPARVADLIALKRPESLPLESPVRGARDHRYVGPERTLYTVDADILRYKLEEGDHDFHVVIRDHGDTHAEDAPMDSGLRRTMIVEAPDPEEVAPESPWRDRIAQVRRVISEALHPAPRFTYRVVHARITGAGFFDFIHGQSGVAPNGLELHPLLEVDIVGDGRAGGRVESEPRNAVEPAGTSGKVWVNLRSGVYWRPGSEWYGKTERGEYLTEEEAIRGGYRPAKPGR